MKKTYYISVFLPLAFILVVWWHSIENVAFGFTVPTSQMTTDETLDRVEGFNSRGIDKVEFLNMPGSEPIELPDYIMDGVLSNPEFKNQVAEANATGATLPPLKTLIALFLMTGVAGASRIKEYFTVSKIEKMVSKTVNVVKKVPVYTRRVVKETLSRIVQVPREVAYTAYKAVREVSYKTKTIVKNVLRYKPQSRVDKVGKMIDFVQKHAATTRSNTKRGIYGQLRWERMEYNELQRASKRNLSAAARSRINSELFNMERSIGSMIQKIVQDKGHGSPHYSRITTLYRKDVEGRYIDRVVTYVKEPLVKMVKRAYTAYKTVFDSKKETFVRESTVTDVSYKHVTEQKEIQEKVIDIKITPKLDKIALALNYVKNLPRIHSRPSNKAFGTTLKAGFSRGAALHGLVKPFRNLNTEVNNVRKGYNINHPEARKTVQKYNDFILRMKKIALQVRKSTDPPAHMFGSAYIQDVKGLKLYITGYTARLENMRNLKSQIDEKFLGKTYARAKHERFSKEMKQISKHIGNAEKKVKDLEADYNRRFHDTMDSIDRLAYLKDINGYVDLLAKGETATKTKSVPVELAVGGLKPVFTGYSTKSQALYAATGGTTVAEPKRTLSKAGIFSWFKTLPNVQEQKKKVYEARKKTFIETDRAYTKAYVANTWDSFSNKRILQLNPLLQIPATTFINKVYDELGIKIRIGAQPLRTFDKQNQLYAIGRTTRLDDRVVTYAKGGESYHNYGLAFDVYIIEGDRIKAVTPAIAAIGKQSGFDWGGDWVGAKKDPPHFQMTLEHSITDLQKKYNSDNYKTIIHKNDNRGKLKS